MPRGINLIRRQLFVRHYLECRNATQAARLAGYAHPGSQGDRILRHPAVQAALAEWLAASTLDPGEITARLGQIARGIPSHCWSIEDGKLQLDLEALREAGLLWLVAGVTDGKYGQAIKLQSAQDALGTLAKIHGLLTEHVEVSGPQGAPVSVLVGSLAALDEDELDRRLAAAESHLAAGRLPGQS